ncbi:hypothetical protein KJY73_19740 [Bowmanella sp. Y26]|uniref:hypothetical protein n=1 Tax=Bowmanella yangjiangensis TaxID=2811230 RepID=UPI001BDD2D95|nr:hypothetical protein [Bowmanella yangjiangensis]MBT1065815.1 hypothetical protein [Bowmanella yangjiangensis]
MNCKTPVVIGSLLLMTVACGSTEKAAEAEAPTNTVNTGKVILIENSIPYSEDASVPDAVRAECSANSDFAGFIKTYARKRGFSPVSGDAAPDGALTLKVQIDDVYAPAGGAWSGAKYVIASGTLLDGGKEVGTFKVKRTTSGGAFAAFKGTCSFVGRNVKAMANDISVWLQNPTKNGRLGEM